jgi:hypothetical protein
MGWENPPSIPPSIPIVLVLATGWSIKKQQINTIGVALRIIIN